MFDLNSLTKEQIIIGLIVVSLVIISLYQRKRENFACPVKRNDKKIKASIKKELAKRSYCWQDPRVSCGSCK